MTLTHDSLGQPLPSFILSGKVAYAPMKPNAKYEQKRRQMTNVQNLSRSKV